LVEPLADLQVAEDLSPRVRSPLTTHPGAEFAEQETGDDDRVMGPSHGPYDNPLDCLSSFNNIQCIDIARKTIEIF